MRYFNWQPSAKINDADQNEEDEVEDESEAENETITEGDLILTPEQWEIFNQSDSTDSVSVL